MSPLRRSTLCLLFCGIFSCAVWTGVSAQEMPGLPNQYGGSDGSVSRQSLNGFSALASLFEARGSQVSTWRELTPRIEQFDTIVWIPAGNREATSAEAERLIRWMEDSYLQRTLVIVLKDYDATRDYLDDVLPTVDSEQQEAYRRMRDVLAARELASNEENGIGASPDFVQALPRRERRVAQNVTGPWAVGLNGLSTHIVTRREILPPTSFTTYYGSAPSTVNTYLVVDGEAFAYEVVQPYRSGRVIVVANGSFLVNYGFVRDGNRELAEQFVSEVGTGRPVLFLESGDREMSIADEDPANPSTWSWMSAWPLSFLFPHLLAASVLMYFAFVPIFGRPKNLPAPSRNDLGQHVDAIAALLQHDGNHARMARTMKHYRDNVRQESRGLGSSATRRRRKP